MAIGGRKRTSEAKGAEQSAKKQCAGIAKVVATGAGGYPGKLLAGMATGALLTFKEQRHPLEHEAVKMVAEALDAAQKAKKQELADMEAKVAGAGTEKASRAKQLNEAHAAVSRLTVDIADKKAELKTATELRETATAALTAAKRVAKHGDNDSVSAEADKAFLDGATVSIQAACDNKACGKITKLAKDMACERGLVDVLASTLRQAPESRSTFGQNTISGFAELLAAKSATHARIISDCAPGRAERAAGVASADAARNVAVETEKATDKGLTDLEAQLADGKKEVKAAEHRVKCYFADMKVLMDGLDKMRENIRKFTDGPIADFKQLKELSPPPPPPADDEKVPAEAAVAEATPPGEVAQA